MAKTEEELDTLRIEYETLNNKLNELTDDELKIVVDGKSVPNNQELDQNIQTVQMSDFIYGMMN